MVRRFIMSIRHFFGNKQKAILPPSFKCSPAEVEKESGMWI